MNSPREQAIDALPLLATKLHAPAWRPGLVSRPRLVAALERAAGSTLTLISAPAGFGKTTLLAEWLAAPGERASAWVSLDRGDNDPTLFWTYVITALQGQRPGMGAAALALLHGRQAPIEPVLTSLINELAALSGDLVLVLDDLHVIESPAIHDGLLFLLDHRPPRLHLVATTRADPPLPLARLRGRGQLTELRASDLRFTTEEAASFLNDAMGFRLSASDVAALEARSEGWIAGLQLAALSMRGHQDIPGFIRTFAGDHRYIVDYLVEEVLQRQPEEVRRFLLQTSILDRLCGPLCERVTGQGDGGTRLESLERGNFFVVPLDDARRWYRYHHLFADVLRARLLAEEPALVPALHQRAGRWFEEQGLTADAIRHALAADDADHAADLIELASTAMRRNRQEATLLTWLNALPDHVFRRRPVLSVVHAGVLLSNGTTEGVEPRLREAERWLDPASDAAAAGMVIVDHEEFRRLPGAVAVYRAGLALTMRDVDGTVQHARRALTLVPEDDQLYRGAAAALLGLASWTNGDLDAAYRFYIEGMASLRQAGYVPDTIGGMVAPTDIRITQGRLHDAMRIYQQRLRLVEELGDPTMRGTADMYVGMSEIHREWNDLETAVRLLAKSVELGEFSGFPQYPYRWRVTMARIRFAQGDPETALALLDEAAARYVSDMLPNVRPIAALKARVWISQGRLREALAWADEQGLSAGDELSYLREYEHITLARLLLAQQAGSAGDDTERGMMAFLKRLLDAAETGGRAGSVIEILALQALGHQMEGNAPAALAALERALELAEPEGYVRIFVDEEEPMRRLLQAATERGIGGGYARRLRQAFGAPSQPAPAPVPVSAASLPEPLTPREIEILRLIAAGLRNQEIADRLFISLPTVKRHVANAYGKLGATHRTEAIARANGLHLL